MEKLELQRRHKLYEIVCPASYSLFDRGFRSRTGEMLHNPCCRILSYNKMWLPVSNRQMHSKKIIAPCFSGQGQDIPEYNQQKSGNIRNELNRVGFEPTHLSITVYYIW